MTQFTKEKMAFLKRLVEEGTIDNLGPSKVQQRYPEEFGKMNTKTFGGRLRKIKIIAGKDIPKLKGVL